MQSKVSHYGWLLRRGWLPPETEGPILPGQVWTNATLELGIFSRRDRYFVKILKVAPIDAVGSAVWFSLIPGPRFQGVARPEADFRRAYRLVPDVIAMGSVETSQAFRYLEKLAEYLDDDDIKRNDWMALREGILAAKAEIDRKNSGRAKTITGGAPVDDMARFRADQQACWFEQLAGMEQPETALKYLQRDTSTLEVFRDGVGEDSAAMKALQRMAFRDLVLGALARASASEQELVRLKQFPRDVYNAMKQYTEEQQRILFPSGPIDWHKEWHRVVPKELNPSP
jgi:hypothetical protein